MSHNNISKTGRARLAKAAGMATSAAAGALAMAIAAPHAAAAASTEAAGSLQSTIDQLLAEMQAAATKDATVPFATPGNLELLPSALQSLLFQQLMMYTHDMYPTDPFLNEFGMTTTPASNTRLFTELPTPGNFYWISEGLDPNATYTISGDFNDAKNIQFLVYDITPTGSNQLGILMSGQNMVINPDGTYTVYVGPTQPEGAVNYLNGTGMTDFLVKSFMGQSGPSSVHIDCIADCPAPTPGVTGSGLSDVAITDVLTQLTQKMAVNNAIFMALAKSGGIFEADNTMSSIGGHGIIGENTANLTSIGQWDLKPDEAMIVRIPGTVTNINLDNAWGQMLPFPLSQTNFNNIYPFQSYQAADGYNYYVISATNPGVANWLDTTGIQNGEIGVNLAGDPDLVGQDVQTEVVKVSDVSKYLPADTPTVSPEEYAAAMTARVLSYDHAMDSVRTSSGSTWVTEQLWLRDIQTAMGADQFSTVFGDQPSMPMWLRLTPALSPDMLAVAKDFFTNPSASFAAIQDSLTLANNDISLPIQLAQTLLQQNFEQTFGAVQTDLASGQWTQALTDLTLGGQQLGSILSDALFDANTSITAGILNARDDLATAVMLANGGFPTHSDLLGTLEWALMPQLSALGPDATLTDFGALLNSAFADLGSLLG